MKSSNCVQISVIPPKVANGTLTVIEMLREVTAEDQAKQNKALHEVQLLMAIYNLKNTTNN